MEELFSEPIETYVAVEGHTDTIEILVNGKRHAIMTFDYRTSFFGDLLVRSIDKAMAGCEAMCDNERLNTVTEYRVGGHYFNY